MITNPIYSSLSNCAFSKQYWSWGHPKSPLRWVIRLVIKQAIFTQSLGPCHEGGRGGCSICMKTWPGVQAREGLAWRGAPIPRPRSPGEPGKALSRTVSDGWWKPEAVGSFHVSNVAFPLLCLPAPSVHAQGLSTPKSWLWSGPKHGRPGTRTSWRRRSQPCPSRLHRSSGYWFPGTVPFHALIYTRTWGAVCRTTYQHGASVPVGPRSGPQAVTTYTLNVCNSHCWCLCEHV